MMDILQKVLEKHNIPHEFDYVSEGGIFDNIFPLIIFGMSIVLIFIIIRQMQGASGRAMSLENPELNCWTTRTK